MECDLGIQVYQYGDTRMKCFSTLKTSIVCISCFNVRRKKNLNLLDLVFFSFDSSVPISDVEDLLLELVMLI